MTAAIDSTFTATVRLTLEAFPLGEASRRIGRLRVYGGDIEVTYPAPVGKLQAGLSLTYLHWKLPQLGPALGAALMRGASSVHEGIDDQTFVRRLEVCIGFEFTVARKENVETQGMVTGVSARYHL